jgi:outer membrane protein OmpU
MKKQLIGTTALVGVGALAATGAMQGAQAADPLSLTVGGYLQMSLEYRNEDDNVGQPGHDRQSFQIYDDGEIQFTASTTLDNGIGVKARIEYEAKNQGQGGTIVDERYLDFSGGFGQLRIGEDDNASNAMHYQAPVAAYMMGVNTPTFAVPLSGGNAITSYPSTYVNVGGDAEKVIWFSPRIAGFQLGLSYAPDSQRNDQIAGQGPSIPAFDNNAGAFNDVISVGLNYVETFNDIDVAVSGGYLHGEQQQNTAGNDDIEEWSAGLNVGFAGFTVGASIRLSNQGANNADLTIWDAGVTYATGPLTVGFTYLHGESEATGGSDETDQFLVSGVYNIGPGVDLWGGVKWFEYDSGIGGDANENQGWIVAVGSSVSF